MLEKIEKGANFDDEAQELGFTESDPKLDLEVYDGKFQILKSSLS